MTKEELFGQQPDDMYPAESGEPKNALNIWRANIINGISQNGILPDDKLSHNGKPIVASYDLWSNNRIFANQLPPINLFHPDGFAEIFEYFMHCSNKSLIPVLLERPYDQRLKDIMPYTRLPAAERQKYAERAAASFLVVFDSMRETGITPEKFLHFIFPNAIWQEYINSPYTQQLSAPTTTVDKSIKRSLGIILPGELTVPDYESALFSLSRQLNKPFWVHAVRLPTMEDVQRRK